MRFCFLNVCGLKTKLLCPDFVDIVQNHDISFFAETKLTDFDCVNLPPNYVCKTKNRSKFQKASGGLAINDFVSNICTFEFI